MVTPIGTAETAGVFQTIPFVEVEAMGPVPIATKVEPRADKPLFELAFPYDD